MIRGCADRILDDYDDVPVRSHILTLAHKRTRECLRQEHCEILELAQSHSPRANVTTFPLRVSVRLEAAR